MSHLPSPWRVLFLTTLWSMVWPAVSLAIYVSPTTLFMDERSRDAQVTIGNSGDKPEEATVEIKFGFPDADSAGTPYVRFVDDPGPEFASAAEWIRPFPMRVRLEPGSEQIVRLLARPPADLPDGEYWTRMIVTGRGTTLSVPTTDSTVRAGVNLEIRLVTSVIFRKGRVSTGIRLRSLAAEADGDSISVWASMAREGNAAWYGTADFEVVTTAGRSITRWSMPFSVHYPVRRRFSIPSGTLEPGDYRVRVRLRAERPDLPRERVLAAATVVDSIAVRVF